MSSGVEAKAKPKEALVHVNVRIPRHVLDYFKQQSNYTGAIRTVLMEHVNKADNEGVTQVTLDQQRWQDILAEENEND